MLGKNLARNAATLPRGFVSLLGFQGDYGLRAVASGLMVEGRV